MTTTDTLPETVCRPRVRPEERTDRKPRRQPRYNVVLLDDDDHTYDYVIRMIGRLFGFDKTKAYLMAEQVDRKGRTVLLTSTREHAEFKQQQIAAYGADPLLPECAGSMSAVLEPVP